MLQDLNVRYLVVLIFASLITVASHRFGAFEIELSLLDKNKGIDFGGFADDKSRLKNSPGKPIAECDLDTPTGNNFCGLTIVLKKSETKGRDFSKYKDIELDIQLNVPVADPSVRFSFRNFHSNYSYPEDYVSLKFNSIQFAPSDYSNSITIPLNAFQVEEWWVKQLGISFQDAQLDFTNILFVEVLTHSMSTAGKYEIKLNKATLTGELITENELLQILFVLWLAGIIYLMTLQRNKLKKVSTTDSLTHLMNRRGMTFWVNKHLPHFSISAPLTMFYFDLDDFKKINDSHGHLMGDELLCSFSQHIYQTVLDFQQHFTTSAFSRLSGDEFCLTFKGLDSSITQDVAKAMFARLELGLQLSCGNIKPGMSLGIAESDLSISKFECLLTKADAAMYHAKKRGKNCFKIFDESVSEEILFRKKIAEKLRSALQNNEFNLNFMPIYHTKNLEVYGAEVLLRCNAQSLKGIGPDVFIPIAEEFQIIQEIDLWVIESSFKIISQNEKFFEQYPMVIAINFSAVELRNKDFVKNIKRLINKYQINTDLVEMEITETSLVETDDVSTALLDDIQALGIRLALDDFGTGYTAFSQLMHYPVDCLKVDKSFIDDLLSRGESKKTMLKAIFSIAKAYKLTTVAEGVEEQEQFDYINARGCDYVQGYLFSKPLIWHDFVKEVKNSKQNNL